MHLGRRKLRLGAAAAVAAAALVAAACSSSGSSSSSTPTTGKLTGGTASIALPAGVTYNWIFPFYAITNASVYNGQQFQWLMYRPLYMFGANDPTNVTINYPLSPANAPVYTNGGKTVAVTMKGWKWSDGSTVDAKSVIFYLNMTEAEKANWYAYTAGLLPDNIVSYTATSPDTVTFQLNKPYSSLWYTYNQLAELTPMPAAWDVTKLGAAAGSGGCIADTAADHWAKCKAVYTFLTAQSKIASTYATSPLWSVVDGPWKLSTFNTNGNVTMVANKAYSGSPKPTLAGLKFVPFTDDATEYTALKTGSVDVGNIPVADLPQKPASSPVPATNPLGSGYYLTPFLNYGIQYAQPNFNNPQVGFLVRQLYIRQALQYAVDQAGIAKAIWRGYASPTSGAIPTVPPNQFTPAVQNENGGLGPYPFSLAKAKALLTSHGWSQVGGVMTCQDPAKCGTGITKGQQLKLTYEYSTGVAAATATWQAIKSDASQIGIDINLVGKTFNTIIGESAPCAPMGPKCAVQVFAFGGWAYDGPGFEPTGEPLFATGAGSNSGNYSDPTMDKLILDTHTSGSLAVFDQYATYAAQQLPFIYVPNPNPYEIIAAKNTLHSVNFNAMFVILPEYWYFTK
ncbi:MAG TPA: ABC transporter substrate-binding protein [Streptosporangiaceae bacterium]|nr:ABC transporter substrate-binding protein [Streptosporangiaceae bacterium]